MLVDPSGAQDLEKAHALQDAVKVDQVSAGKFDIPNWDLASQKKLRDELVKRGSALSDTKGMFGPRGKVDPQRHLIGTATAWGGNG